ncbi:nucleoside-diphosphate-sugar epimerase [Xylariomycetidae sp. FL2044]|nr:nucleoside-diphosphate-sugar epimerase [Xylariomycetidae sp. FL2044]
MIKMKEVTKISILSRKPVKMAQDAKDPRINVIIHTDFGAYDSAVLAELKGAKGCVWALGPSQTQVSKEEFIKTQKDWPVAASKAFRELPGDQEPFNFVYVSAGGATLKPGMFTPLYGRVKGETETALGEVRKMYPLLRASAVRLGAVDAAAHPSIQPYLPQLSLASRTVKSAGLSVIRAGYRKLWTPTESMGRFLTELAMGKHTDKFGADDIEMIGDFPILNNTAIRRLSGEEVE